MMSSAQETVFALDCGATNWRIYRAEYVIDGHTARVIGEPQPSPLTSFVDRRLPAVILLKPDGTGLEGFGESVEQLLEDEKVRERVRDYFKPSIGVHLEKDPLPHQKRFTHSQALRYTSILLNAIITQLKQEKWRASPFDERIHFAFAYPIHWRYENDGQIFNEFKNMVLGCFDENLHNQIRFVGEPEGAIFSMQRQGLLSRERTGDKCSLIIDIGGSTTDLISGQVNSDTGQLDALSRYGDLHGGGLYDDELAKNIAEELDIPISGLIEDPSAFISLRVFARNLKESLSRQMLHPRESRRPPQRTVTLVLRNGEVYRRVIKLDEAKFCDICRYLISDFEYLVDTGIREMNLVDDQICQVVLVGGGSKLFTAINYLRERFGEDRVVLSDNPDEIVAYGTCLEYGRHIEKTKAAYRVESRTLPFERRREEPLLNWELQAAQDHVYSLRPTATTIGRKRENDVWLKDNQVSRFHAEIREIAGKFAIIDLDSSNGTRLNGDRIVSNKPHPLTEGDEIKIGNSTLILRRND
jgi:hypothetical protein